MLEKPKKLNMELASTSARFGKSITIKKCRSAEKRKLILAIGISLRRKIMENKEVIEVLKNERHESTGEATDLAIKALELVDRLPSEDDLFNICNTIMHKDSDKKSMIWFSDTSWNIAKAIMQKIKGD